jgi:dihydroorotase
LAEGAPADIAVLDPDLEYVFDEHRVFSKSRNSPFIGRRVRGKVEMTIVAGAIAFRHGEVQARAAGASR